MVLAQWLWPESGDVDEDIVVVTADWLDSSSDADKASLVDSLNAKKVFTEAFLLDDLNVALAAKDISQWQPSDEVRSSNLWAQLAQLSSKFPDNQGITVYTTNRLSSFKGNKLAFRNPMKWEILRIPIQDGNSLAVKGQVDIVLRGSESRPFGI